MSEGNLNEVQVLTLDTTTETSLTEVDVLVLGEIAEVPDDGDLQDASPLALELWESLGPWYRRDLTTPGHPLLDLCQAIIGGLDPVEEVIRDTDDGPGWSIVADPLRAPRRWLQWLAQFAGLGDHDHRDLTDDEFRQHILEGHAAKRGSPDAIRSIPKPYLSGTKTVYLIERHGGAYRATLTVLAAEVMDPQRLAEAVKRGKPAGIVLTVSMITGGDYATLHSTHSTYAQLKTLYTSYADILQDPART